MTTNEKITTFWISKEFLLEDAVIRVANTIGEVPSEMRGFHEGYSHRNCDTMYLIEVNLEFRLQRFEPHSSSVRTGDEEALP